MWGELWGVDGEVRLGEATRLTGEYAESEGTDALTFTSDDGGITYRAVSPSGAQAGGPYTVAEGSSVTLAGSGSGDPTLQYGWDYTAGGTFTGDIAIDDFCTL